MLAAASTFWPCTRSREAVARAHRPAPADRDGVAAPLQRRRPRGGAVSAHGRPSPLCPEIQAALGAAVCAAQQEAAGPPVAGADPKPCWTLRRLVGLVWAGFARPCCRETIRAALHRLGLSWKKAKKLLGRADPARREAFIAGAPAVGRRAARPASPGLSRRGPHPPRRRSRLWMGRARRALSRRLVGAGAPGIRPHRMTRNTGRAQCVRTPDPFNKASRQLNFVAARLNGMENRPKGPGSGEYRLK